MDRVVVEIREPGREARRVSITATVEVGRECSGILLGDSRASRRHIALTAGVEGLTLTDLGSSNGTTVNGTRVTDPVVVRTGDVIRLGGTEITVVERSAPPPRPASAPPERLTLLDTPPPPEAPEAAAPEVPAPPTIVPSGIAAAPSPVIDGAALAAAAVDGLVTLLVSVATPADDTVRRAHGEILEYWLTRHSGRTVATTGDAVVCAFATVPHALLCTIAAARGIAAFNRGREGAPLAVRTALHAGGAVADEVVLAMSIAAAAEPGEVLVSSPVQEAAGDGHEFAFGEPRDLDVGGRGPVRVLPLRLC